MRLLVTGAAGFIGSQLAQSLVADGHDVVGIDCFTDYYPRPAKEANLRRLRDEPRFSLHEADLGVADLEPFVEGVDLVYHQAGGLTVSAGGRLWRAAKQDQLNKSLRGRIAARLPRKGRLGRLRRAINPVRRYQEALAAELGRIDAQVMDLIARDPDFYRQLIEPERGGELGELKAPVLLEDVKDLATRSA